MVSQRPPSQRVQRYAAARGLTPSQLTPAQYKAARGHAQTPEHKGVLGSRPKEQHFAGRDVRSTYSDRQAERYINRAADNGNRVQLFVHSKGGGWQLVGGARGYSGTYLAEQQAKAGGLRAAVGAGDIYDGSDMADIDPDDIDAWQIAELEV